MSDDALPTPAQIVSEIYQGFLTGDLGLLFAHLSEEILWQNHSHPSSPFYGVHQGKEAVVSYFHHMVEVELERFDIHSITEVEHRVIALIDVKRTLKSTQEVTEGQFVHSFLFQGSQILQVDIYEASAALA